MPKFLVPHRTGAHRIAAIALFRALLTQCTNLSLPLQQQEQLSNIVRNRFKEQRYVTSHTQLHISFTAGYEAIDHLDAAVAGEQKSRLRILHLLEHAPKSAKKPPGPRPWILRRQQEKDKKTVRKTRLGEEEWNNTTYSQTDLFQRPLPLERLSGKRHVPVLFSANQIPVLRLKKPQPKALSAYLDSRIKLRQKRHDKRHALEDMMRLAAEEDRWDRIVSQQQQQAVTDSASASREPLWGTEARSAWKEVQARLVQEREKNRVMAEKMQDLVDRETALLEKEQAEEKARKADEKKSEKEKLKAQKDVNAVK